MTPDWEDDLAAKSGAAAGARGFHAAPVDIFSSAPRLFSSPTSSVDVPSGCTGDLWSLAEDLDGELAGDTLSDCLSLDTDLDLSLLRDLDFESLSLTGDLDLLLPAAGE